VAVRLSVCHLAVVPSAIGCDSDTVTTRLAIAKLTVIPVTVRPDNYTMTVCSVVLPFTLEMNAAVINNAMAVPVQVAPSFCSGVSFQTQQPLRLSMDQPG
jgi:hypothetical protein